MAVATTGLNSRTQEEMTRYLEALGPLRPLVEDDSLTEIMRDLREANNRQDPRRPGTTA